MSECVDVVIVGAGGGGAVCGLALARQGIRVLVLEQASGPPQGLRGEILQPNGQRICDRLGLLETLPRTVVRRVRYFQFHRAGGQRLCTIDYGMLPPPYDRAIVTLPNVVHHAILGALERAASATLWYGASFKGLRRDGAFLTGVVVEREGRSCSVEARVVVGADGALSRVREALGIPSRLHHYPEAYLIAMLDNPEEIAEGHYYVGRRTIFGLFPAAEQRMYVFYMIPSGSMAALKAAGLEALRRRWLAIDPRLEKIVSTLKDWNQTAYMPTGRVQASTWVTDGAALLGDAAHAMNPHASQGRMQAMEDAMALAEIIPRCLERGDCSAQALSIYERRRRPQVDMLQRLADEQVRFWNTGNPLLAFLRDRVFKTLDRNRRLQYRVLTTTAGLRKEPPFTLLDRFIAIGLLPDPRAHALPSDSQITV